MTAILLSRGVTIIQFVDESLIEPIVDHEIENRLIVSESTPSQLHFKSGWKKRSLF